MTPPSSEPEQPRVRPVEVLLVEDSPLDAELLEARLLQDGLVVQVDRVSDERAFVAALEQKGYDIVLSDFHVPGFDALQVMEVVRARSRDLPVIVVSGSLGEEKAVEVLHRGATDYVLKDRLGRLGPSVRRALRETNERTRRRKSEEVVRARDADLLRFAEEERRRAEAANRTKDEFLAVLSHELRSPLNALLGWLKLLRDADLSADERARALASIEKSAHTQSQVIEDLLDVSRIVTGKLRIASAPMVLRDVLSAAAAAIAPMAEAKGVTFAVSLEAGLGMVQGDAARLQQAVWNLLSNAVKFTPAGGTVTLRAAALGPRAEVVVSDTGKGIAPAFLPMIFERFRQADSSSTRSHGGLGLGLSIVRHVVSLHHGTVEAASLGEGHGASFTVSLPQTPLAEAPAPVIVPPAAVVRKTPEGPLGGLTLLVVDDDEDARLMMGQALKYAGAIAKVADSPREARSLLASFVPDAIISDISMPGEDGYAFIRSLRDAGVAIPAVALTGFAGLDNQRRAHEAGFQHHVTKPVDLDALIAVVLRLVGRPR